MVLKNQLLKDLERYNKELDKHVGSVDTDLLVEKASLAAGETEGTDEFFTLLSSQFMDLRTEVNLLRKHLTNDVQNMANKVMEDNQKHVISLLKSIESKIFLETRQSLNNHFELMSSELGSLKDKVEDQEHKMGMLTSDLSEIRDMIQSDFGEVHNSSSSLANKIKSVEESLKSAVLSKRDVLEFHDKQKKLLKNLVESNKRIQGNVRAILESNQKRMRTIAQNDEIRDENIEFLDEKPLQNGREDENFLQFQIPSSLSRTVTEDDERLNRIVDIDRRLSRLHSLR